jgi:hypothetical protein
MLVLFVFVSSLCVHYVASFSGWIVLFLLSLRYSLMFIRHREWIMTLSIAIGNIYLTDKWKIQFEKYGICGNIMLQSVTFRNIMMSKAPLHYCVCPKANTWISKIICHIPLCSMVWGESWLLVLLILKALFSIMV